MTAARRPSWLPDGCPTWCLWKDDHAEADSYDDRWHSGAITSSPLTADHAAEVDGEPTTVEVSLYRHYREVEARVHVGRNEAPGMYLTLEEAERLARELLARVAVGRSG